MGKVELPSGWKSVKLGEIAEYYDGTHQTPEYIESGVPFISVENIDNLKGSKKYISTADFDKYKIKPQKNDIFMTRIGELGLVNIVEDDEPLAYYVTLTLIRPKEISPHFLLFFISSNAFQRELNKRALLNAVPPKINLGDIGKMSVSVPPLSEQQAIAEILTAAEKLIAVKERFIAAKQKQKQWLMQNLLTGKRRLSGFSGEWEKVKLGEIATGFQYGLNASSKEYDGTNKYLRITDIDEESRSIIYNDLTSPNCKLSKEYLLSENDLLFARTGASVGKTYLYNLKDENVYFAGYLIKCNVINACPKYVFYVTLAEKYKKWVLIMSQRSGQPGINSEEYQLFTFPLPPLPEQQAIANVLTTADREIELLKKELEQHKQIKKYLMQKLLTGKIRVKGASE